jgi:hypothetical protein
MGGICPKFIDLLRVLFMTMPSLRPLLPAVVAILVGGPPPAAGAPIVNFTGGTVSATRGPATYGWEFEVADPIGIAVTHLALYDYLGNGLAEGHEVGIWDADRVLVAHGVVTAGTPVALDASSRFRTVAIEPVGLASGGRYTIGALFPREDTFDYVLFRVTGMQVDPMISYRGGRAAFATGLSYPAQSTNGLVPSLAPAFFGPSFVAFAVPEPGAGLLLGTGSLAGFGVIWRRGRRRRGRAGAGPPPRGAGPAAGR